MRSLIALAVLVAIGTLFWLIARAQPYTVGTFAYNYENAFPWFLETVGAAAVIVAILMLRARIRR